MAETPLPKRGLGRGLSALMADLGTDLGREPEAPPPRADRMLPVESLRPNPDQPRRHFDEAALGELTASLRAKGVIQPLIVRPDPREKGRFEIVAGERRWRAALRAGLAEVPVLVRDYADAELLEIAIIENVQRADLNPIEEAVGYQQLIDEHGYTQVQLAEVIGKSRPHIANTLRLLKLPESVREYLRTGQLSAGHARALVTVPDPEAAARRIVEAGMSVRDVEAIADGGGRRATHRKPPAVKDADTRALEKALSDSLGLTVAIDHRPGGGEVRIHYKSLEQLDEVCRRLRG